MAKKTLIIGTRGSELALIQSEIVKDALLRADKNLEVEFKIIKTEGDINQNPIPLDVMGKGLFTKGIEKALISKEIDVAVHSLKDMPTELPEGLTLAAYLNRGDPRDCLVSKNNLKTKDLPKGAIVGTDSLRRKAQILAVRRDLDVRSIRGNVPVRIKKMDDGEYDAVILAVAGLNRLNIENRIAEYFEQEEVTSAPGQAILAVEIRENDEETKKIIEKINDKDVEKVAKIERNFSAEIDGGCKKPVGVFAECKSGACSIYIMAAKDENSEVFREKIVAKEEDIDAVLKKLVVEIGKKIS